MARTVEFVYDVVSPASYLAYMRLPGIAERTGAAIVWTPVFLGGVMKGSGNTPPGTVPAKAEYMRHDLARSAARYDIPFTFNHNFPVNTLMLQRAAVALLDDGDESAFLRLTDAAFEAIWVDAEDTGDADIAAAVLSHAGFDPAALTARASEPAIKHKLKASTESAVARGVFGAPTMFVGPEMFFGQDRLDYVERALAG